MKTVKKGFLTRVNNCTFEGHNYVGNFAHVHSSVIGKMSYIGSYSSILYTKIGRFCSISSHVYVIGGEHPTRDWVSTHPAFYKSTNVCGKSFSNKSIFKELKYADKENKYLVVIGNDVWIGANVLILNGITIGDGAIIASGSVITRDVSPYSIVGGNPAKEIRKRFSDEEIEFLLENPYWEFSDEWLTVHSAELSNIDQYKKAIFNAKK